MAPKKPSMLARQRQLVKQQQQVKAASSKQLPPKGGSSAGKPKAVAQRTATAVAQKVKQDITVTRALADNMQRNVARDARQIPTDKSPSVRRVGPGGANPKSQPKLPSGQKGGSIQQKGGALTTRGSSAVGRPNAPIVKAGASSTTPPRSNGGPVQPVRVRDMGKPQVSGSGARPAIRAGSTPKPNAAAGPGGVRALLKGRGPINIGGLRGGVIGAVGGMAADALGSKAGEALGKALRPVGRAIDNRMPGVNSKDEARRRNASAAATGNNSRFAGARDREMERARSIEPTSTPTTRSASPRPISQSGGSSGSRPLPSAVTRSSAPSSPKPQASKPADAPKPPNIDKVETETTDAPKPPTKDTKPKSSGRRAVGRDEMIMDNMRRAKKNRY